jgi:superfamily II DNA/RNA helicase
VHRIGRTARAQRSGLAITLINGDDVYKFKNIEKLIDRVVHKIALPEGFPEGPDYSASSKPRYSGGNKKFFKKKGFKKKN